MISALYVMEIFHDFAFVVNGKKRKKVVEHLAFPRSPSELSKLCKMSPNRITGILRDLSERQLVSEFDLDRKGVTYMLTKRGEQVWKVLESLVEPRSQRALSRMLHLHRREMMNNIKQLILLGFVTAFKPLRRAKKMVRLTEKGEMVREKLD